MNLPNFTPNWLVIHHSATDASTSVEEIRSAHLDRGFDDIGYHWLIDRQGRLYPGRSEKIAGAHVKGFNQESLGVCLIGNFDQNELTPEAIDTLIKFLPILCLKHAIAVENIIGHSDAPNASSTRCPGSNLRALLPALRQRITQEIFDSKRQRIDRKIFFHTPKPGPSCKIEALIFNTGFEPWGLQGQDSSAVWRAGGRLRLSDSLLWEGRAGLDPLPVQPYEFRVIRFDIAKSEMPYAKLMFEADIVEEGENWFGETGLKPCILVLDNSEFIQSDGHEGFLLLNPPEQIGSSHIRVSGRVKNFDQRCWQAEDRLQVLAEISCEDRKMLTRTQSLLSCLPLGPGEAGDFSLLIEIPAQNSGLAALTVRLSGSMACAAQRLSLPLLATEDKRLPYDCNVELEDVSVIGNFILCIKGKVQNTGVLPWDNTHFSIEKRFKLGAKLLAPDSATQPIWEGRYELPLKIINSSEGFSFSIETTLIGIPAGEHRLQVQMLKEQDFWFDLYGAKAAGAAVKINPQSATLAKTKRKVASPLVSDAAKLRVLIIAPTLPLFDRQAGGKRMLELIKVLRNLGCQVSYAFEGKGIDDPAPYLEALEGKGVRVIEQPLSYLVERAKAQVDLCIIAWYETAIKFMPLVRELLPDCPIIIDSIDVHWKRIERGLMAGEIKSNEIELTRAKAQEVSIYQNADLVWAVTDEDRETILASVPECEVSVVPYLTSLGGFVPYAGHEDSVLFIGGFNHPPNKSAALRAYEICCEYRRQTGRTLKLYIIGADPPEAIQALHDGNQTYITGFVPDLAEYYNRSRLLLTPIVYGAGIKGKICDAIAAGLCVATTQVGNEGLGLKHLEEAFLAESTPQFVQIMKELFVESKYNLAAINKRALSKVEFLTGLKAGQEAIFASLACKQVTICIVTYNQCELLRLCLDSLFSRTNYPNYHVAVLSNGCSDGTHQLLKDYKEKMGDRISIFLEKQNNFFVKTNNFLIRKFSSSDIVLMNNDVETIEPDWLLHLFRAAYSSHQIGAAGGMILDQNGLVSEAGAAIQPNGHGLNFARGSHPSSPELQRARYVGYVSGCLLYMKRSAISLYGALDEDFHPMYFEDAAWQYNLHKHGLKTIFTPLCKARHREGSTSGTALGQGMKRYQEINRQAFLAKFPDLGDSF